MKIDPIKHNMRQAAGVSEYTAFFYMGKLVEVNHTTRLSAHPEIWQNQECITGRFG